MRGEINGKGDMETETSCREFRQVISRMKEVQYRC